MFEMKQDFLTHLETGAQDSGICRMRQEGRIDRWVLVWVSRLDVDGASAQRVLQAHRGSDTHRGARSVRWEEEGLIFNALLISCCGWDKDHLKICRLVVQKVLLDAFVLLALERGELLHAIVDRLDDLCLLLLSSKQLVWKEPLGAGDVCKGPVLMLGHLLLCGLHDFWLVDNLKGRIPLLDLPTRQLPSCQYSDRKS